jgi:hypothetical protein
VEEIPQPHKMGENPQEGLHSVMNVMMSRTLVRIRWQSSRLWSNSPQRKTLADKLKPLSWKAATEITSPTSDKGARRSLVMSGEGPHHGGA